jgi:demethylmenaquinone methyltransferase / 2-methoxy-6-polyprenyl-1,4-benzoquinol methylase
MSESVELLKEEFSMVRDYQYETYIDLKFQVLNAENLDGLKSDDYDLYTIAFGIRNVTDRMKALKEAHRILRRGGRFMCLEFSEV